MSKAASAPLASCAFLPPPSLPACCDAVMGGAGAADGAVAQPAAGHGGSKVALARLALAAPISVVSVLKFKPDDPPWMAGEPDEVAPRPSSPPCPRGEACGQPSPQPRTPRAPGWRCSKCGAHRHPPVCVCVCVCVCVRACVWWRGAGGAFGGDAAVAAGRQLCGVAATQACRRLVLGLRRRPPAAPGCAPSPPPPSLTPSCLVTCLLERMVAVCGRQGLTSVGTGAVPRLQPLLPRRPRDAHQQRPHCHQARGLRCVVRAIRQAAHHEGGAQRPLPRQAWRLARRPRGLPRLPPRPADVPPSYPLARSSFSSTLPTDTPPPDLQVTLSKVRALKTQIVDIVRMLDLDLSTAAMAHVYLVLAPFRSCV